MSKEKKINNVRSKVLELEQRLRNLELALDLYETDLYKIDKSLVHETNDGYLSVDYTGLIPVLIEEVKRLGKEIEEIKKLQSP